jgi:hypothetical protein
VEGQSGLTVDADPSSKPPVASLQFCLQQWALSMVAELAATKLPHFVLSAESIEKQSSVAGTMLPELAQAV